MYVTDATTQFVSLGEVKSFVFEKTQKNIFIKNKKKITIVFWALWVLSFAIMFFYVNLAEGNEVFGLTMVMLALAVFPIAGLILLAMVIYFAYSAMKIAVKFHDSTALRLFVLYFVRAAAWFVGAVITTARYLTGKDR